MKKSQLKYVKTSQYLRRSSFTSQTSTSPKKKANESQDQLTRSQVQLDKTQQSFRSSNNSPLLYCHSASSQTFPLPPSPTRSLKKRPSQIIGKKQLSSMHERSVIKMLGLNLEAICTKANHEKNKIAYICQSANCTADSRLGCSYCLLEQHSNHQNENLEVQQFCKIFDDRKEQFYQLCGQILKVPDYTEQIEQFFINLKTLVQQRIDQIQEETIKTITAQLYWEPLERELSNRVQYLSNKNVFDMNNDEIIESITFIQGQHLKDIEHIIQETSNCLGIQIQQAEIGWNDFSTQLQFELINALDGNNKIQFYKQENKKQYLETRLQQLQQKQQCFIKQFMPFQEMINNIQIKEKEEEIKKVEEIKKQQEIKRQQIIKQQEENKKKEEELIKQQEEQKQQEKIFERQQQLRTFPHNVYTQDCKHRIHCNTIPIFSCCNKAYPCTTCHGYLAHPPRISIPSYRYCMNCLEIYLVGFPTNFPVNCIKCQKEQQ